MVVIIESVVKSTLGVIEDMAENPTLSIPESAAKKNKNKLSDSRELIDSLALFEEISPTFPGVLYRYVFPVKGDSYFIYLSPNAGDFFEIDPSELLVDPTLMWQKVAPEDVEQVLREKELARETMQPFIGEFRIVLSENRIRWAQVYSKPVRMEDGGLLYDGIIVETKGRHLTREALEDARARLQSITDNAPGVIYRYERYSDGSHAIAFIGAQVKQMLGLDAQEVQADPDVFFNQIHPDDVSAVIEAISESSGNLGTFCEEYRIYTQTGELRWVQDSARPRRTKNGATVWDGFLVDISDRKETELELSRTNKALEDATKKKDEFLASMSHELRTPLNSILSMAEGMQEGIYNTLTEEQSGGLEIIKQSGLHLLELINEVLDLAKIESGNLELNYSHVSVKDACETALTMVAQQANRKNISISLDVPANLPTFRADCRRVKQILVNLLNNAIKFTPDNGLVAVQVLRMTDKALRFSIKDSGIGISADQINEIFEPFYQVDSALNKKYSGTGLGLALVKRYVDMHNGKVFLISEIGKGSTFFVDLPYIETDSQERSAGTKNQRAMVNGGMQSRSSGTILIVEDNDAVVVATKRYLEMHGFNVIHATSGHEAIDIASNIGADVILMDIQMPEMDGLEAIKRIRSLPAHKNTPIISVTGLAMHEDERKCLSAGADRYFSKPYSLHELTECVKELISVQDQTEPLV